MNNKESIIERQKIDCNCNDCGFLIRTFEHRQQHEDYHFKWQKDLFDSVRRNVLQKAVEQMLKGLRGHQPIEDARDKQKELLREAKKMNFVFDKGKCTLSYGFCSLKGIEDNNLKVVSFIPETCQLETQDCFKHRLNK